MTKEIAWFLTLPAWDSSAASTLPMASVLAAQAYTKGVGGRAQVLDLNLMRVMQPTEDCVTAALRIIRASKTSLVGISVESHTTISAVSFIRQLHAEGFAGKIVIGGVGANSFPRHLVPSGSNVQIAIGTAESYFGVDELLPIPNYEEFLDMSAYQRSGFVGTWYVQSSRGCPYRCSHCIIPLAHGRRLHHKPMETLATELEVARSMGAQRVFVVDDALTINMRRTIEIADAISGAWGGEWLCMARSDQLSEGRLEKLVNSGCVGILVGADAVETADRARLNRSGQVDESLLDNVAFMRDANMSSTVYLLAGFPGQSADGILRVAKLKRDLDRIDPGVTSIQDVRITPGTNFWHRWRSGEGELRLPMETAHALATGPGGAHDSLEMVLSDPESFSCLFRWRSGVAEFDRCLDVLTGFSGAWWPGSGHPTDNRASHGVVK